MGEEVYVYLVFRVTYSVQSTASGTATVTSAGTGTGNCAGAPTGTLNFNLQLRDQGATVLFATGL